MKGMALELVALARRLRIALAYDKMTVHATDPKLRALLKKVLGIYAGEEAVTVRKLGVDFAICRKKRGRVGKVQCARFRKAARRLFRAFKFKGKKGAQKLFSGGVMPVASFGADVSGCPKAKIREFAGTAGRYLGYGGRGAKQGLAWAVEHRAHMDHPGFAIFLAPLMRYAKEWWLTSHPLADRRGPALTPVTLVTAFDNAATLCANTETWKDVRHDPVALAIRGAEALKWKFTTANIITTPEGAEHNLMYGPPQAVEGPRHGSGLCAARDPRRA